MIAAAIDGTFSDWRKKARQMIGAHIPPQDILWSTEQTLLDGLTVLPGGDPMTVPKEFLSLSDTVSCHRDDSRWALLYRVLFRLTHGEPYLLKIASDRDVHRLDKMRGEVGHDLHRMHAFVRFRKVHGEELESFVAWHRPDHLILRKAGPWFAERFAAMRWSILTPDGSAHWDTTKLTYGPGVGPNAGPEGDALEDLWKAYYAATFNPARVNLELLKQHVPTRYWASMPETEIVAGLVSGAANRQSDMMQQPALSAEAYLPATRTLPLLAEAVHACRGCDLYQKATQPVFGEGPTGAPLMLIGEQPGENEDETGRPFVGPAGQLLDRALAETGLSRSELYLTSAVKHFRYEERGKRRIHKTASKAQVVACQPWLESQIQAVQPKLLVCMGRTAALSVLGREVTIGEARGKLFDHRSGRKAMVTVHPSFLLRIPEGERQSSEYASFVRDLLLARESIQAA